MAADHNTLKFKGKSIHEVLLITTEVEHVHQLLEQGERPCDQCFMLAARNGSFSIVCKLLEVDPSGLSAKDQDGKSLLSYFSEDPKNILKLLKMGAEIGSEMDETVLEQVILCSKSDEDVIIEILKILSSTGVKIDTINGVPLLKLLVTKPRVFNEALELGVNPCIPEIRELMTILLKPNIVVNDNIRSILVKIFTKLSNLEIYLVEEEEVNNLLIKYCSEVNALIIKSLIQSRVPLVKNTQKALKTLVLKQDLTSHQADQLRFTLTLYAKNGHELVDEEGISLVKYCNNEATLLCLLRLGADPHVREMHRFLARHSSLSNTMKDVYSIIAAAGVKLVDEHNRSLIAYNYDNPDSVCFLLKLGASAFREGENLLANAFISNIDPVTELTSYIKSGFDVMKKDKNGCTFLCTAMNMCNQKERNTKGLQLVLYMLTHIEKSVKNFQLTCESGYHPQEIVIQNCRRLCDSKLANSVLDSKFKEPNRLVTHELFNKYAVPEDKFAPVDMSLISYYVSKKNFHQDAEDMLEDVDYLRQHGFSVNGPGVSPLTVALLAPVDPKTAVEFFIQRGVNVEKRVVQFQDHVLQDWKQSLKVPDAAVMAAYKGRLLEILQLLAPHFAFPPLALLLFKPSFRSNAQKLEWFSALLREGRVPHGTRAYQAIRDKVREMSDVENNPPTQLLPIELEIPEHIGGIDCQQLTMFDVAHRSPLSLLELSWVAVRMQLADTAAGSDTQSLAQLFTSIPEVPPGLTEEVIRQKIAQVREAEDKWLPDELQLLENPPSLLFVNCVLNLPDEEPISSDSGNSDVSEDSEYDDYEYDS